VARRRVPGGLHVDLPHGLDLPRRKVEFRLGITIAACPDPETQAPLTVNLGATGQAVAHACERASACSKTIWVAFSCLSGG
jgi:hypothetical protein